MPPDQSRPDPLPNVFVDKPFRLRVGVRPLDLDQWIDIGESYQDDLALKAALLTERHGEVVDHLPDTEDAAGELLEVLAEHLCHHWPDWFTDDGNLITNHRTGEVLDRSGGLHPIDLAGRLVQEDLCLLVERDAGLVLGAASLCFPSRWRLADKLGRSLLDIHQPVPGYADQIGAATDAAIARITVDRPIWRLNWSIHDDHEMFQPDGHGRPVAEGSVTAANVGEATWLRVERQTLRRLPTSNAVVFTIRTSHWSVSELSDRPDLMPALATMLRSMPADMQAYKSLSGVADAVLGWLDAQT